LPDQIPEDLWLSQNVSIGICLDERNFTTEQDGLFILPILSFKIDDDEAEFIGLILQPSGISPGIFQRVGLLLQSSIDISGTIPGLEWTFLKTIGNWAIVKRERHRKPLP
jgi:hypothetical protein